MNNVDNRIVEMTFDNGQFEKDIHTSIKSLDELEKALKLEDSAKSFKDLQKSVDAVKFDSLVSSVETIAEKFTAMGTMAHRVLERITDSIYSYASRWAKALSIDQIFAGKSKYEMKTKAVQTILGANPDKTVADVEKVMNTLNKYTDETSYDFAEMANTIGKFTANGVDLEVAERAMEGIGNAAAKAGAGVAESNRAMYNFAQALAAGKVQLIDWKSIENANMGTKEFKETIIDTAVELGTLKKGTNGVIKTTKGAVVDYKSFNTTLSQGWFTSDVLLKSLDKYADKTTDFGLEAFKAAQEALTLTDAINAVKDAVSTQWMNSFQFIFGDLEESKSLWTNLANGIIEITDSIGNARNELLGGWKEAGGREILLRGLVKIFTQLKGLVLAVADGFRKIIPPITVDTLMKFSNWVDKLGDKLQTVFGYVEGIGETIQWINGEVKPIEDFGGDLKRGSKGDDVKLLQQRLIDAGYGDMLGSMGADGIFGSKTEAALKAWQKANEQAIDGVYDAADHAKMNELLSGPAGEIERADYEFRMFGVNLKNVSRIAAGFAAVIDILAKAIGFLFDVAKAVLSVFAPIGEALFAVAAVVGDCFVGLRNLVDESGVFGTALTAIKALLEPVRKAFEKVRDAILDFFGIDKEGKALNGVISSFGDLWERAKTSIKNTKLFQTMKPALDKLRTTISDLIPKLAAVWEGIKTGVKNAFTAIWNWIVQNGPKILSGVVSALASVLGFLGDAVSWVFNLIKQAIPHVGNFIKKIPGFLKTIGGFFSGLWKRVKDSKFGKKISGFFKGVWDSITSAEFWKGIGDWFSGVWGSITNSEFLKNAWDSIKIAASGAWTALKNVWGWLKTNIPKAISAVGNFFKSTWDSIRKSEFGKKVGGWFKTAWQNITSSKFWTNLADWISSGWKKVTGWDGWGEIGEFFKRLWEGITGFFNYSGDDGEQKGFFERLKERLSSFEGIIDWVKEKWAAIKEKLFGKKGSAEAGGETGADGSVRATGGVTILDQIMAFFKMVWDKGKTWILVAAGAAAVFFLLIKPLLSMRKLIKGVITNARDLTKSINNFSKTKAHEGKYDTFGTTMLKLAGAIALLAGVVWVLSKLSKDELIRSGIALGVLAGLLVGIMFLGKLMMKDKNAMKGLSNLGKSFLSLAGAIAILTGVVWLLSKIDWATFGLGMAKLAGMLLVVGGFLILVNKFGGSKANYKGLIGLAAAVGILTGIVFLLGTMKWAVFGKGLLGLTAILGLLGAFMIVLNKLGGKGQIKMAGFLALAFAIGMLAGIAALLGSLNTKVLIKGLVGLALVMFMLSKFMKSASSLDPKAASGTFLIIAGIAGLVVAFSFALKAIKNVRTRVIVSFMLGMMAFMLAFKGFMRAAGGTSIKSGIGALTTIIGAIALVVALSAALKLIKDVRTSTIISFMLGMTVFMLAFGLFMKLVSSMGIAAGVSSLIACVGAVAVIAALALAIRHIRAVETKKITAFMSGLSKFMLAFGVFVGLAGAVGPVGALASGVAIAAVAAAIGLIIAAFAALKKIPGFQEFMNSGAESIGEMIGTFIGSLQGASIKALAKELNGIEDIETPDKKKLDAILDIASAVSGFAAGLPGGDIVGTIAGALFGWSTLSQFSGDLKLFGQGLKDFTAAVHDIDFGTKDENEDTTIENLTTRAIEVATMVKTFGDELEANEAAKGVGGRILTVASYLLGYTPLTAFSSSMTTFGEALKSFTDSVSTIEFGTKDENEDTTIETLTTRAIEVATMVKTFSDELEANEATKTVGEKALTVGGYLLGYTPLKSFSASMKTFGKSLKSFTDNIAAIDYDVEGDNGETTKIEDLTARAIEVATLVKTFSDSLEAEEATKSIGEKALTVGGYLLGYTPLKSFSASMKTFGTSLKSFTDNIAAIDYDVKSEDSDGETTKIEELTARAIDVAGKVQTFAKGLEGLDAYSTPDDITSLVTRLSGWTGLGQFSTDMRSFGEGLNSFTTAVWNIPFDDNEANTSGKTIEELTARAITIATQVQNFAQTLNTTDETSGSSMAENIGTIIDHLAGYSNLSQFSADMPKFAEGLSAFASSMSAIELGEEGDMEGKTDRAVAIAEKINELATKLPPKTDLQLLAGKIAGTELGQFSADMPQFAAGLKGFHDGLKDVPLVGEEGDEFGKKADAAVAIAKKINSLNRALPKKTSFGEKLGDWLFGDELSNFSEDIGKFGEEMLSLSHSMDEINFGTENPEEMTFVQKTGTALGIATTIAGLLSALGSEELNIEGNKSFLQRLFTGEGKTASFMTNLGKFGEKMASLGENLKKMDDPEVFDAKMQSAITAFNYVKGALSELAGAEGTSLNWENLKDQFAIVTESVLDLSLKFGTAIDHIEDTDADKFFALTDVVGKVFSACEAMTKLIEQEKYDDLGAQIGLIIDDLINDEAFTRLTTFATNLKTTIDNLKNDLETSGQSLNDAVDAGISSGSNDTSGATAAASASVNAVRSFESEFEAAGRYLIQGLAIGMSRSKELAEAAARVVVRQAIEAGKHEGMIQSPSKATEEMGMYLDYGLANGLLKFSKVVESASADTMSGALDGASLGLTSLSRIIDDNLDADPTIRPVVDLSGVAASSRAIDGMLSNNGTVTIGSAVSTGMAASASASVPKKNQNGSGNQSGASTTTNSSVNLSGNNFYIRGEQDIHDLASELASLTKQQQRSLGATV